MFSYLKYFGEIFSADRFSRRDMCLFSLAICPIPRTWTRVSRAGGEAARFGSHWNVYAIRYPQLPRSCGKAPISWGGGLSFGYITVPPLVAYDSAQSI